MRRRPNRVRRVWKLPQYNAIDLENDLNVLKSADPLDDVWILGGPRGFLDETNANEMLSKLSYVEKQNIITSSGRLGEA